MSERRLGPYRLVEALDAGAWGPIWAARHEHDGRAVRLVELTSWRELDPDARAAARSRLERARRIDDPRLIRVLELSPEGEPPWVALEPRVGRVLEATEAGPAGEPASRERAAELIARACECLRAVHDAGLVHGGLRLSSFELDDRGGLRLDGTGLTLPERAPIDDPAPGRTPAFLAPEQVRHEAIDSRTDLFALGAIAYELLTGRRAFGGDTPESIVYRIVHEPIEISDDAPGLNPALAATLRRALARDPARRHASADELASSIRAAAAGIELDPGELTDHPQRRPVAPPPAPPQAVESTPVASATPPTRRRRRSAAPFVAVLIVGALATTAALWWRGRETPPAAPPPVADELTTSVRTEPPGAEIRLDGIPLDAEARRAIRFRAGGPYGTLTTGAGCRTVEHTVGPADADGEIVLELDALTLDWRADPGVSGATVRLDGRELGATPTTVTLDLCREQRVELVAPGHRPAELTLPAGATTAEARAALERLRPEPIPRGTLQLPGGRVELVVYVDGERQPSGVETLTLDEGRYAIRLKNEFHWIDVTHRVDVRGGAEIPASAVPLPALGELVVQAYPANCEVAVARDDGSWREVGETPFERTVAAGNYRVRITWQSTGERKTRNVTIGAGDNPPVRVAFGS